MLLFILILAGIIYVASQGGIATVEGAVLNQPGSGNSVIDKLAAAIAVAEGYPVPGSIPSQANNPGDLTQAGQGYAGDTGATLGANIIVFDSAADGWNALYAQLNLIFSGSSSIYTPSMTISQMGELWAGDMNWASNVALSLGVSTSTPLSALS